MNYTAVIVTDKGNYLMHHGTKGMHWGQRRYQNEDGSLTPAGKQRYAKVRHRDIRNRKDQLTAKYAKEDARTIKMQKLENAAYKLAEKYDFDGDDGGGGRTERDRRAGEKYMKLWDEHAAIQAERDAEIGKKVSSDLLKEFGKANMRSYKNAEYAKTGAAVTAVLLYSGALLTHPLITLGGTAVAGAVAIGAGIRKGDKELKNEK